MTAILIGSQAMRLNGAPLKREPKDWDYLLTPGAEAPEHNDELRVESFTHELFNDWDWSGDVANLDEIYTVKVSHSYWEMRNKSWDKHMFDIVQMKKAGAKLIPELHAILYKVWVETHGAKPANLEQSPQMFFNNNVTRIYEHDSIHAAVAYYDGVPLFNRILRDDHPVAVSRAKFEALDDSVKVQLVREEVYATALERQMIPSEFSVHPKSAYSFALRKTITSFTKGWFPTWIVDNFDSLRLPDVDYVKTFHDNSDRLVLL